MSNHELLCAISDIIETKLETKLEIKLEAKLEPINNRLDRIEQTQENIILPRLDKIEQSFERLEQSFEKMEQSQKNIELTLENNVLPRLQTIEDCYLSTFERYQSGIGQIETMQSDIDIMKAVIADHSDKFQKLA